MAKVKVKLNEMDVLENYFLLYLSLYIIFIYILPINYFWSEG
jgi:positive regulator of sigma E activity